MKQIYILASFFFLGIINSKAQTTQLFQSFESLVSDNWNYSINPITYNTEGDPIISGSDDIWGVIEEFTGNIDNPSEGDLFFGTQDLNNSNGGGQFYHTITLDAINVSSFTDMTLSFDYFSKGYDSSDEIKYEILLDNTTPFADNAANDASVGGINLNKNTLSWTTISTVIPNGTSFIRLRIKAKQDGSSDFLGIDNIKLVAIDNILSTDFFNEKPSFKIFPNPSSDFIKITGLTKSKNYQIYNAMGVQVNSSVISDNETIDIQSLPNGLYFLNLDDGNTLKFIKK